MVSGSVEGRRTASVNLYASQDSSCTPWQSGWRAAGVVWQDASGISYAFKEFRPDSVLIRLAVCETPVAAVVKEIMKESDNLNAEALLCRLGAQTTGEKHLSAEAGLSAIRALIRKLGYRPDDYNLAHWCGLSNYNFISPELLVAFLRYAYSRTDVFQKLYKALPIGLYRRYAAIPYASGHAFVSQRTRQDRFLYGNQLSGRLSACRQWSSVGFCHYESECVVGRGGSQVSGCCMRCAYSLFLKNRVV